MIYQYIDYHPYIQGRGGDCGRALRSALSQMQREIASKAVAARRIQRRTRRSIEGVALREQCRAIMQVRLRRVAMPLPWGLEISAWQQRYVFLTAHALCYQKVITRGRVDDRSMGLVRYSDIVHISGRLEACLLTVTTRRLVAPNALFFHRMFKQETHELLLNTPAECELWACNLLRLVGLAGFAATVSSSLEISDGFTQGWSMVEGGARRAHTVDAHMAAACSSTTATATPLYGGVPAAVDVPSLVRPVLAARDDDAVEEDCTVPAALMRTRSLRV